LKSASERVFPLLSFSVKLGANSPGEGEVPPKRVRGIRRVTAVRSAAERVFMGILHGSKKREVLSF
jgi:hypothetical protein